MGKVLACAAVIFPNFVYLNGYGWKTTRHEEWHCKWHWKKLTFPCLLVASLHMIAYVLLRIHALWRLTTLSQEVNISRWIFYTPSICELGCINTPLLVQWNLKDCKTKRIGWKSHHKDVHKHTTKLACCPLWWIFPGKQRADLCYVGLTGISLAENQEGMDLWIPLLNS